MELCTGGGMLDRIKPGQHTEASIAGIIRCVLRFIAQCHAKGIIYRDVKPDNFLFLTQDADSPMRATDFGLSIRWECHCTEFGVQHDIRHHYAVCMGRTCTLAHWQLCGCSACFG